jgi:hypothetical protein
MLRWLKALTPSARKEAKAAVPKAPEERLSAMVVIYANMHTRSTRAEWVAFAIEHAIESYRSGFLAGLQHAERIDLPPGMTPELVADMATPGWQASAPVKLEGDPYVNVEEEPPSEGVLTEDQLKRLARSGPAED